MTAKEGFCWDFGPTPIFLIRLRSEAPLDRRYFDSAKLSTELLTLKKVEVDQSWHNTDVELHSRQKSIISQDKVKIKRSKQEVFVVEHCWVMLVYRSAVSFRPLPP